MTVRDECFPFGTSLDTAMPTWDERKIYRTILRFTRRQIEHRLVPRIVMQVNLVTRQATGVVEVEHEARLFTDEHRLHVARVDLQLCQVAEGVQHGQSCGGGE